MTTVVVIFPYSEDENDRIAEINRYELSSGLSVNLQQVGDYDGKILWGTRDKVGSVILIGSYKQINVDDFLIFLQQKVNWLVVKYVQVLVKSDNQNDASFNVYSEAGKVLITPALRF